jgi:DNA (cytosine-5)-methyltransferase 1
MLRVLDLFSGIGGFSLGLERTGGFETVAFCEIEDFPRRVLARHWPEVPCYHDITKLTGAEVGPVDIICGGFPCQDISASGGGAGIDGERSGLWSEFARLIGDLRPRFVIVENSPNLLSGGDGRWMGRVLGDLAALGYDAEWHVVPASAVGAPHERERVWIIAYSAGLGQSGQGQLLESINSKADAYREASGLVDAVQAGAVPFLCGRHDGVPARLAQPMLHAIGNAVVPQIPELIGHAILAAEREYQCAS